MSKGYQCPRWIKRHRKLFFYISFGCAILTYLFVLNKLIANVEQNDFQLYAYKFNSLKRLLYSAEEENTNERQRVPLVHKAERNMLFIHVGKAGGSTLQAFIKREKFLGVSTGAELALQVNGSVHCDQPQHVDQYTSFLVTVRNPIDRFVSWFGYANPKNKKYVAKAQWMGSPHLKQFFQCYEQDEEFAPTLSFMPSLLDGTRPEKIGIKTSMENKGVDSLDKWSCRTFIRDVISGQAGRKEGFYSHITWNYEWYLTEPFAQKGKEFFVVRTEHFWDDVQLINDMVGGSDKIKQVQQITYRKKRSKKLMHKKIQLKTGNEVQYQLQERQRKYMVEHSFPKDRWKNVCAILCTEIQYYKEILNRALNIDVAAFKTSMKELEEKCPREARISNALHCQYINDN